MDDWSNDAPLLDGAAAIDRPVDELLQLLADRCARSTIVYLFSEPETTLEQLAAIVAADHASETETIATEIDYELARTQLYHSTLPRLDDLGLLAFHPSDGTISETDIPLAIYAVLGVDCGDE
ncbi:hypothetical protein D8Y22_07280 [Salinadaptatus halalkaliphilus]|uniref:DUF7344 domain-containing protein n=1 Tax=Salinadaptatus halalkaliphilus TaxID=2419781 RepID=A0A4S3TSB2_9EURY|nr:hypothetical protein [Salinadaptatus halalkaliphilus]THE65508.1 hypothetical protein D8Y22_07280 [Salinadaptatus halalkaliphilus]